MTESEFSFVEKFLADAGLQLKHEEGDLVVYEVPQEKISFFAVLSKNWYGVELWNKIPSRWISNNATISIYSPTNQSYKLSFSILSFYKPRTLWVYLNDGLVYNQEVPTKFEEVSVLLSLKEGMNVVCFYSPDGCQRPVDIPELNNRDSRCLSFAFQNIVIEPIEAWNFLDIGTTEARKYLINGWSEDEISGNLSFVWADALNSSVLVVLDEERPLNLSFRCHPFVFNESANQELWVYFNGNFVASLNLTKGWKDYSVLIPSEFTKKGINYLEFKYRYAERPKDYGINEDTRTLAAAFDWIRLSNT